MERRLAAILAADVAGYTRLMGDDEAGTLHRLTELREQVLEPLIAEHHGRVVKLMGDGLLVEFASVVDALTCAVAWQNGVAEREAETDEDRRLQFRIGINLGDVIVEGEDIHGDGVNIAARLEGLAEPGGICLSGDVFRQAKGKMEAEFEDLGNQELKNVAEPIRVYRVIESHSGSGTASEVKEALSPPDKPSIAVLPFENLSGDPEHQYFSDGITEDIITELRQQVLEPLIAEHHGRLVKLMGDGLLVEFASVVDALTCAVAWQIDVVGREAAADEGKRLKFRICINLGDVIVEGDDIHGDGVNIAARLEGLVEPGGICLSEDA